MGIRVFCPDPSSPVPRSTVMELTCDGRHGFLVPTTQCFADPRGFIAQYADAMRAGWKDTFAEGNRVFLGPCCSKKVVR